MQINALVALGLEFVVRATSLEEGLVDASTASDDTNSRTSRARYRLLRTRRETDPRLIVLRRMSNNSRVVARSTRKRTAIADLLLDVAHDRSFGELREREDVPNGERGLLAAVDKRAGVHPLRGDERLRAELVPVGIAEDDASEGGPATWVVDDVFHDTAYVAIAFREVEVAQLGGRLALMGVRLELWVVEKFRVVMSVSFVDVKLNPVEVNRRCRVFEDLQSSTASAS